MASIVFFIGHVIHSRPASAVSLKIPSRNSSTMCRSHHLIPNFFDLRNRSRNKLRISPHKGSSKSLSSSSDSSAPLQRTLDGFGEAEQIIKKSRFIGLAKHCESWDDAQDFISYVRKDHPKSRHVCFGFVAGSNPVQERCSDDGEPTGTAGAPILGGIKGEGLSDTVCAVVRYSGGIKLGAGGLIRAYGGTARLALREAPTKILIPKTTIRISATAANSGAVYDTVGKFGATPSGELYNTKGELELTVVCETEIFKRMFEALRDSTKGEITLLGNNEID